MENARLMLALAVILSVIASLSLAQGAPRDEGPVHVPYDNVSDYYYPNLNLPGPENQGMNDSGNDWMNWWNQFDGGQQQNNQSPNDQNQNQQNNNQQNNQNQNQQNNQSNQQNNNQQNQNNQNNNEPKLYVVWVVSPAEPNIY